MRAAPCCPCTPPAGAGGLQGRAARERAASCTCWRCRRQQPAACAGQQRAPSLSGCWPRWPASRLTLCLELVRPPTAAVLQPSLPSIPHGPESHGLWLLGRAEAAPAASHLWRAACCPGASMGEPEEPKVSTWGWISRLQAPGGPRPPLEPSPLHCRTRVLPSPPVSLGPQGPSVRALWVSAGRLSAPHAPPPPRRRPSARPAPSSGSTAPRVRAAAICAHRRCRRRWIPAAGAVAAALGRCRAAGESSGARQRWRTGPGGGAHPLPAPPRPAGYGFITSEDIEDEVFVHQVRWGNGSAAGGTGAAAVHWQMRRVAGASALRLTAAPPPLPSQSNIETTGYRSLKEGEEVEFDLVVAEDGKKKAFRVTGPGGAPPQVRAAGDATCGAAQRCNAGFAGRTAQP